MLYQVQSFFSEVAVKVNLPLDILKTIFILFLNILLSALFPLIRSPILRKFYGLTIGGAELIFLLNYQSLYVFAVILINFGAVSSIKFIRPFLITVIISIAALLYIHFERFLFDYSSWKIDCSVYVMILVTKLTYYGLSLENSETKYCISSYLSYCLFFPSLMVGPTFSYERYLDFLNLSNSYQNIKLSLKNILLPLFMGIIFSALTAVAMTIFDPSWVLKNQTYQNQTVWGKLLAINLIGITYRIKFYTAWYFAQSSANASGLSYSQNGNNDAVISGSVMFQIQPNPKKKTQYWNSSIQTWLKVVIYDSIYKFTQSQSISVFGTFFISAFWHGVYLSYYISFIQWGILTYLTKWIYKMSAVLPQKVRSSSVTTVLVYALSTLTLNYLGMGIVILEWQKVTLFYSQLYYCVSIALLILFILSFIIKPPKQKGKQKSVAQVQMQRTKLD